jgi:hypothetical protein
MNKSRELLKRLVNARLNDIFDLLVEAKELLAQPEPFKTDWAAYRQGVEDAKREPLSEDGLKTIAVEDGLLAYCDVDEFIDIARAIEKAHGIGENDA